MSRSTSSWLRTEVSRSRPMKEGECITAKEIRWDLIDLEAPLYICDGAAEDGLLSQSPETRPRPRWPRVHRIEAGGIPISALIDRISSDVDRVVIDKTGFTAPFNLLLDFAPARDPESSGPAHLYRRAGAAWPATTIGVRAG